MLKDITLLFVIRSIRANLSWDIVLFKCHITWFLEERQSQKMQRLKCEIDSVGLDNLISALRIDIIQRTHLIDRYRELFFIGCVWLACLGCYQDLSDVSLPNCETGQNHITYYNWFKTMTDLKTAVPTTRMKIQKN